MKTLSLLFLFFPLLLVMSKSFTSVFVGFFFFLTLPISLQYLSEHLSASLH